MSKKRKHDDHEEHVDESWLIPYADILTLLLALFIVLYSMNTVDVKKFEEMSRAFNVALSNGNGVMDFPSIIQQGEDPSKKKQNADDKDKSKDQKGQSAAEELVKKEQAELEDLKKKIDDYIDKHGLSTDLETKLNMSQLMITISDRALFEPGRAAVNPKGRELAIAIATMLQQYPAYNVVISGHTDTTPMNTAEFRSNWDLSAIRAVRFMDIMLENEELVPNRFSAIGYGEYHPVADNDTIEGKAKNRRVEVSIIRTVVDTNNVEQLEAVETEEQ